MMIYLTTKHIPLKNLMRRGHQLQLRHHDTRAGELAKKNDSRLCRKDVFSVSQARICGAIADWLDYTTDKVTHEEPATAGSGCYKAFPSTAQHSSPLQQLQEPQQQQATFGKY